MNFSNSCFSFSFSNCNLPIIFSLVESSFFKLPISLSFSSISYFVDMKAIQYLAGHVEGSEITGKVYIDVSEEFVFEQLKKAS